MWKCHQFWQNSIQASPFGGSKAHSRFLFFVFVFLWSSSGNLQQLLASFITSEMKLTGYGTLDRSKTSWKCSPYKICKTNEWNSTPEILKTQLTFKMRLSGLNIHQKKNGCVRVWVLTNLQKMYGNWRKSAQYITTCTDVRNMTHIHTLIIPGERRSHCGRVGELLILCGALRLIHSKWFLNYILNLDELFHLADKCVVLFAEGGQAASTSYREIQKRLNSQSECTLLFFPFFFFSIARVYLW